MHPTSAYNYHHSEDYSLHVGVLASVLVHLVALLVLSIPTKEAFRPEAVIDVTIVPPEEVQKLQQVERKQQLVSPSEKQEATTPKEAVLQSDQDNSVLKEQVKRGADNSAPILGSKGGEKAPSIQKPQQKSKVQPQKEASPKEVEQAVKPLTNLKLDTDTLISEFALTSADKNKPQDSSKNQKISQSSYKAFSRPMGSGAMFIGLTGSSDHLPNLPDGDITLLNTKANKFAVFVRRVATQVFAQIRSHGWDYLNPNDIASISTYATVRAVLSPKGELLKVVLESSSRSAKFDEVIVGAAKKGASDPNPPKDAVASDGNVHFIFQAKSWVDIVPAPRSGIPTQRRWLLLATGLD